ncbi:type II toxin-antitoxin system VapC family toxin [Gaopeijia maritima]|uniref:type II toxin-antitoxin system VapC family toxin n=1 Tax=Gaopeijia maritima TaxID=3119007 RepID=UPI00324FB46B
MRLLLDTHALIWWDRGEGLSSAAESAIRVADQVYVSAVSGWEIAIKASLGRLRASRRVEDAVSDSGFEELPIRLRHARRSMDLPWHHRDPFDRMLVAQAQEEGLTLVTRDQAVAQYDVKVLDC